MTSLPKSVLKKDGHLAHFQTKQIISSLQNAAIHAQYENEKAIASAVKEIILRLKALNLETIPVANIRKHIIAVLEERRLTSLKDAYEFTFLRSKPVHIKKVLKRNGAPDDFQPHKIFKGILKTLRETRHGTPQDAERLTKEILHRIDTRFRASIAIPTTTIRQIAEEVLGEYDERVRDAYRSH